MKEISRREKEAGIVPEPDIDTYMKVKANLRNKLTLYHDLIFEEAWFLLSGSNLS
jgi:hypothetical protein